MYEVGVASSGLTLIPDVKIQVIVLWVMTQCSWCSIPVFHWNIDFWPHY